MDLRRLRIGDLVRVLAVTRAEYNDQNQRIVVREELSEPNLGYVVGAARIQIGEYSGAGLTGAGLTAKTTTSSPPFLIVKGVVTVWLVRFGLLNRPVKVQDKDAKLEIRLDLLQRASEKFPLLDQKQPPMPESCRSFLREWASNRKRDERGRWVKE